MVACVINTSLGFRRLHKTIQEHTCSCNNEHFRSRNQSGAWERVKNRGSQWRSACQGGWREISPCEIARTFPFPECRSKRLAHPSFIDVGENISGAINQMSHRSGIVDDPGGPRGIG